MHQGGYGLPDMWIRR